MKATFLSSISYSFSFVFITDLTDKSLFLIIILSQKLPSLVLYIVSLSSLLSMNLLSILIGCYIPQVISGIYMQIMACILFFSFGVISIHESTKKEFNIKDLITQTRKELNLQEDNNDYVLMNEDYETNYVSTGSLRHSSNTSLHVKNNSNLKDDDIASNSTHNNNEINIGLIFLLAFMLCLSDIGDKSQITVITMAAIYDLYGVLIGSSLALICTVTLAVLFGNWICEKISPKVLLFIGGILFLIFGFEVLLNIFFQW